MTRALSAPRPASILLPLAAEAATLVILTAVFVAGFTTGFLAFQNQPGGAQSLGGVATLLAMLSLAYLAARLVGLAVRRRAQRTESRELSGAVTAARHRIARKASHPPE